MMKRILLSLVLLLLLVTKEVEAQDILNPYYQRAMVGLVDEFIDRFNGKTFHPDIPKDMPNSRKKNLMALFELTLLGEEGSPSYKNAEKMVETIISRQVTINYEDTTWFALAHCNGTLNGKEVLFNVYLTVENRREDMYKWVIAKVDGDIFDIKAKNANDRTMLDPDVHENNFMALGRMTIEQPYNVSAFMRRSFSYDATAVFAYLVNANKLKINYVKNLEFIFTQIPGYIFNIGNIDREHKNSGWLITNFYESSSENTKQLLKIIYTNNMTTELSDNKSVIHSVDIDLNKTMDIYQIRLSQLLVQINDYVEFIKNSTDKEAQKFYTDKLTTLFSADSKVTVCKNDNYNEITLADFCKKLAKSEFSDVTIDYITLPDFDVQEFVNNQDKSRFDTKSKICPFMRAQEYVGESSQTLAVRKETTFYGIEWIPVLGNLKVTVKSK